MPPDPNETCWTIVHAASRGEPEARSAFSRSYETPIRRYLEHRWRGTPASRDIDDAVQDVFVECIKEGGALESADPERGDFRGLLYGVARNVARRFEERAAKSFHRRPGESIHPDDLPARAEALSRVFDRAWAQSLFREAVLRHASEARARDADFRRRYRILRLRHQEGLPVRDIATRLAEPDVDKVHNEYRRARREFRKCLREVVAMHTGVTGAAIDAECQRLVQLLGG